MPSAVSPACPQTFCSNSLREAVQTSGLPPVWETSRVGDVTVVKSTVCTALRLTT